MTKTYIYFDLYKDYVLSAFFHAWTWHWALSAHLVTTSSLELVGLSASSNAAIVLVVLFSDGSLSKRWFHSALWRSICSGPYKRGCDRWICLDPDWNKFLATLSLKAINKNTVINCNLKAIIYNLKCEQIFNKSTFYNIVLKKPCECYGHGQDCVFSRFEIIENSAHANSETC